MTLTTTATTLPATEKQLSFIIDLAAKRDWPVAAGRPSETVFDVLGNVGSDDPKFVSRSEASQAIDFLLSCRPKTTATRAANDAALAAVEHVGVKFALRRKDTNEVNFFEIVQRKSGRRFVNMLIGHPGEWQRVHLTVANQAAAARAFHADEKAGMDLYADEFRVCSKCDSPLSDERSRAARLGPVCAKNLGFDW